MDYKIDKIIGIFSLLIVLTAASPAIAQSESAPSELTEGEAVRLALGNNPTLRAALLELQAAEQSLEAAESERTPSFTASLSGGHDDSLGATGSGPSPNESINLDLGLSWTSVVGTQLIFEAGGSWSAREAGSDSGVDNLGFDSAFGTEARLRVVQPLLRGAGRDVGEARQRAASFALASAEHSRDDTASDVLGDVLGAYWELWYAQESLEVTQESLELARQQLSEAEAQVNTLGTMARADALRFASEVASLQEELVQAEADRRIKALEFGRLLGISPETSQAIIAAEDGPSLDFDLDLDEAIELATLQSPELLGLEADVAAAQDRIQTARDATLPSLDLTATVAVGNRWNESNLDGWDTGDRPAITGLVGLELELPLSSSQARAELAETRILAEAAELRFEARRDQIETDAMTSVERLETARQRVSLANQTVAISAELAEAERERLNLGMTTAFQVLESQASHRRTELRRLRAVVDRTKAAIDLHQLTGQLLLNYAGLTEGL